MCNCIKQVAALVQHCKATNIHPSDVLELNDPLVAVKCLAYTLVLVTNADPVAFSILPRKILINGEPLLIEHGNVYGKDFLVRPSLQVILEEEVTD
ncbi:nonstructural protein [Bulbul coronavirus HKU11-796]|uniref:Nonstructural protein n=1 Tax=Bulbul coronavirus HKU11-796 TaxID=572287 RepID=B6VDX2_9NIDO|nr:nonstructural protein [Bulbul coronavirus HKU11-796]